LNPEPALAAAIDLFNRQAFFECHEVLEDLWRPLDSGPEKLFLQGILQVAVGYHHLKKQNFTGAKNKLHEGLEKLEAVSATRFQTGIELGLLINSVQFSYQCLLELGAENIAKFPSALIPTIAFV